MLIWPRACQQGLVVNPPLIRNWVFPGDGDVELYLNVHPDEIETYVPTVSHRPVRLRTSVGVKTVTVATVYEDRYLFERGIEVLVMRRQWRKVVVTPTVGTYLTRANPGFRLHAE